MQPFSACKPDLHLDEQGFLASKAMASYSLLHRSMHNRNNSINDKIPNDLWTQLADEIAQNIAKGSVKDGFIEAIEKCGALFAENFPLENAESSVLARPTSSVVTEESSDVNPNELSDSLVILEE